MRVFYGLGFRDASVDKILEWRDFIADRSIKGRFTSKDNIHLTLEFIGEVRHNQIEDLEDILMACCDDLQPAFRLTASHIGTFTSKNKDVVWLGIESSGELKSFQKALRSSLKNHGYKVEERKYTPHITIGRQVLLNVKTEEVPVEPFELDTAFIALFESKRVGERLVYEPVVEIHMQ